jgi:hypothetical protein
MKSIITALLATLSIVVCASISSVNISEDFDKETVSADCMLERADVNRDTFLDTEDLMIVLASMGSAEPIEADINNDDIVDQLDAFLILHLYATQCEGF